MILFCKWHEGFIRQLLDGGQDLVCVLDEYDLEHLPIDADLLARMVHVYRIKSWDSVESCSAVAADLLMKGIAVEQIVSWTEFSQYGAGVLADHLKSNNYSLATALAVRDKRWMKHLVRQAGVATAASFSLPDATDRRARAAVLEKLRFPAVIKPVNGMGTNATRKIEDESDFHAHLDSLQERSQSARFQTLPLAVEAFIEGDELHIDALWGEDGEPQFFCVSQYHVPLLTALKEWRTPGSVILRQDEEPALYEATRVMNRRVNTALGIRQGLTHMEVFRERGTGTLYFSEIANRMGGACISEAIGCWAGWDLLTMWGHALIEGRLQMPAHRPSFRYIGWLNLLPIRSGKVTRVPSSVEIEAVPGVLRHEVVIQVGTDCDLGHGWFWGIFLVLGADTMELYRARVAKAIAELRIEVE